MTRASKLKCENCDRRRRHCAFSQGSIKCDECNTRGIKCRYSEDLPARQRRLVSATPIRSNTVVSSITKKRSAHIPRLITGPSASQSQTSYEWLQLLKDDYKIVIGIDIGTRFSSACWRRIHRDTQITPQNVIDASAVQVAGEWRVPTEVAPVRDGDGYNMIFGPEVETYLADAGILRDEDVFRLLKLSLIPSDESRFSDDGTLIKEVFPSHNTALARAPRQARVFLDFQGSETICVIDSVTDVFRAFLSWFWDQIKAAIAAESRLDSADMDAVMSTKTEIAVAVPAIWTDSMINTFRKLLREAGFPNAHIKSEPKCAAAVIAYKELRRIVETHAPGDRAEAMESLRQTIKIILDLGHGTADLTTCSIREIEPLKVATSFMGRGSLWGAQRLNDLLKRFVSQELLHVHMDNILSSIAPDTLQPSEEILLTPLARGFEIAKRQFSARRPNDVKVFPSPRLNLPPIPAVRLGRNHIVLTSTQMRTIFDEYLTHIRSLLNDQLQQVQTSLSATEDVEIIAVGGGSLTPYILESLQLMYPEVKVTRQEDTNMPMVVKGAFSAAVDPALGRREFARSSFGVELTMAFDPRVHDRRDRIRAPSYARFDWEVPDCACWGITLGQSTDDRPENLVVTGHIYKEEKDFDWPMPLESDIIRTDDPSLGARDGAIVAREPKIQSAGYLRIEVQKQEQSFRMKGKTGARYLEIEFRALPVWSGVALMWKFIVHRTGIFPEGQRLQTLRTV